MSFYGSLIGHCTVCGKVCSYISGVSKELCAEHKKQDNEYLAEVKMDNDIENLREMNEEMNKGREDYE